MLALEHLSEIRNVGVIFQTSFSHLLLTQSQFLFLSRHHQEFILLNSVRQ